MVERGDQRQRRYLLLLAGVEQDRQPDAGNDDADIFDLGISQQALHVGLHGREQHAVKGGGQA